MLFFASARTLSPVQFLITRFSSTQWELALALALVLALALGLDLGLGLRLAL